ncbi:hypothetical protein F511_23901 [Dorcoceras hygrometricum]|uniref:Uncharacterized protein n=1 Tax=Dorcoceras hygrometricum TaxID=472368 RepID=A0A2Z7D6U8_9LAMI|nr:hypothetical protein F511_23901 [Dorcoceras hygrometricum]
MFTDELGLPTEGITSFSSLPAEAVEQMKKQQKIVKRNKEAAEEDAAKKKNPAGQGSKISQPTQVRSEANSEITEQTLETMAIKKAPGTYRHDRAPGFEFILQDFQAPDTHSTMNSLGKSNFKEGLIPVNTIDSSDEELFFEDDKDETSAIEAQAVEESGTYRDTPSSRSGGNKDISMIVGSTSTLATPSTTLSSALI